MAKPEVQFDDLRLYFLSQTGFVHQSAASRFDWLLDLRDQLALLDESTAQTTIAAMRALLKQAVEQHHSNVDKVVDQGATRRASRTLAEKTQKGK